MLHEIFKPGLPFSTAVDKPDSIKPLCEQQLLCNFRELYHREDPYSWIVQLHQTLLLVLQQHDGGDTRFARRCEKIMLLSEAFAVFSREWHLSLIEHLHNGLPNLRLAEVDSYFAGMRQLCGKYSQAGLCIRHGNKLDNALVLQVLYYLLDADTAANWSTDLDEILFDLGMAEEKSSFTEVLQVQTKLLRDFFAGINRDIEAVWKNEPRNMLAQ